MKSILILFSNKTPSLPPFLSMFLSKLLDFWCRALGLEQYVTAMICSCFTYDIFWSCKSRKAVSKVLAKTREEIHVLPLLIFHFCCLMPYLLFLFCKLYICCFVADFGVYGDTAIIHCHLGQICKIISFWNWFFCIKKQKTLCSTQNKTVQAEL